MNYPETNYDLKHIESVAKRRFFTELSIYLLLILIMVTGILSIVFFSEHPLAFIGGGAALAIAAVILIE